MAEFVHADVVEQILVRSDVEALIRFKRVCKSWHSLITSPSFVNLHLNHSYHKDLYNNQLGSRRIRRVDCHPPYFVVGSSNGLVCTISIYACKVLVGNPFTKETRELEPPTLLNGPQLCWGFGYDSANDDYKLMLGSYNGTNQTRVQVLSLKSNVWRVTGLVKYTFNYHCNRDGVLCNGALHWIVRDDETYKSLIIAYDLSKDEFREIPQPDDPRYAFTSQSYLGIIKQCLCFCRGDSSDGIWLMKKYNVKQSWKLVTSDHEMKYDIVHWLKTRKGHIQPWGVSHINKPWLKTILGEIDAHVFVQSLVSPVLLRDKRSTKVRPMRGNG